MFQFPLWTLEVWKKTARIVCALGKQWPASKLVSIRMCSHRLWLSLVCEVDILLARVPVA